ncbi:MAG: hypothetical protein JWR07_93 [Nevskia sp.]|nr:hypothetical protein [Nevskia sp.]
MGKWQRRFESTENIRHNLIGDEFPKTKVRKQNRSDLVQKRDAMTRDDIDRQIKAFFR